MTVSGYLANHAIDQHSLLSGKLVRPPLLGRRWHRSRSSDSSASRCKALRRLRKNHERTFL